jgi:hypothetical protein
MARGVTLAGLLALAACGGGGGGSSSSSTTDGGGGGGGGSTGAIDRGGAAIGPIDGFGSVIVNGVRWDSDDALIIVDGAPAAQGDLAVGQVVIVVGERDDNGRDGVAERIEYDDNVEGRIEDGSLDPGAGTFRVLGQTIVVTAGTIFDDSIQPDDLTGLAEGDAVEVSGLEDARGRVVATRIERDGPDDDGFEVIGTVEALDAGNFTFRINDLVVDYSQANLEDFPAGEIRLGDLVEAEGARLGAGGELVADEVELRDELRGDDSLGADDEFEVSGIVTGFRSAADFDVAGITVATNSRTEFSNGTRSDLARDVRVEVDGTLSAGGTLVADEVEFKPDEDTEFEAFVDSVDPVAGTVTVLGVEIATAPGTRYEDKRDDDDFFSLGRIRTGDFLEIDAYLADGRLTASQIERDEAEDTVRVKGLAADVNRPELTVAGVLVRTNAGTDFEDENDAGIGPDAFFGAADGRAVQADGVWNGNALIAEEIELESD